MSRWWFRHIFIFQNSQLSDLCPGIYGSLLLVEPCVPFLWNIPDSDRRDDGGEENNFIMLMFWCWKLYGILNFHRSIKLYHLMATKRISLRIKFMIWHQECWEVHQQSLCTGARYHRFHNEMQNCCQGSWEVSVLHFACSRTNFSIFSIKSSNSHNRKSYGTWWRWSRWLLCARICEMEEFQNEHQPAAARNKLFQVLVDIYPVSFHISSHSLKHSNQLPCNVSVWLLGCSSSHHQQQKSVDGHAMSRWAVKVCYFDEIQSEKLKNSKNFQCKFLVNFQLLNKLENSKYLPLNFESRFCQLREKLKWKFLISCQILSLQTLLLYNEHFEQKKRFIMSLNHSKRI